MTKPHTFKLMDQDLDRIRDLIVGMGQRAASAISRAAEALDTGDEALALEVVESDRAIDAMEDEINAQVVRLLALRQPVADDLRATVAIMKMAGDLERIGDYAKNMARRVAALSSGSEVKGATATLRRQAREVRLMLEETLDAFTREDGARAEAVIVRDVEIDDMTNALFREFVTHMMEDPRKITPCLHYAFIAKNTERMGDLVTGAAEQVVFLTTGHHPGARPKGASTTQLRAPSDAAE